MKCRNCGYGLDHGEGSLQHHYHSVCSYSLNNALVLTKNKKIKISKPYLITNKRENYDENLINNGTNICLERSKQYILLVLLLIFCSFFQFSIPL